MFLEKPVNQAIDFNEASKQIQMRQAALAEARAEQEHVMQLPVSKTLKQSLKVAQSRDLSDFWPGFKNKYLSEQGWESYSQAEQIAVAFVDYIREQAKPSRKLHGYIDSPNFVFDALNYVRIEINKGKLRGGLYFDPASRLHGALSQLLKDMQTELYQCTNGQLKRVREKYQDWSFLTPDQFNIFMAQHEQMMRSLPDHVTNKLLERLNQVIAEGSHV